MDGNSMFSAVVRQLSGVCPHSTEEHSHYTVETLQRAVADYLIENPYQDHTLACQEFLSLRRIDRMALTGIAGLLSATIHLLTPDICFIDINDCDTSTHIFLAIVGEGHIVSLEPPQRDDDTSSVVVEMQPLPSHSTEDISNDLQSNAGHSDSRSEDKQTDEDREHAEDELALEHQVGLRGLAYETCLQREDIDGGADNIFCVAPGEGKTPISIAKDEFFDEMFNPTKYPFGDGGLKTPRDTKVTERKYFNQRLLDADRRFGKDIEYLLTVQYMVEDKQVHDAENIAMRQAQGRRSHGGLCQEQGGAPADGAERRRVQIPQASQRIAGILPTSAIPSPRLDPTTGVSNVVLHSVGCRHAVARCHPDHCTTVRHHVYQRRRQEHVFQREERVAATEPCDSSKALSVPPQHFLPQIPEEQGTSSWRVGGLCHQNRVPSQRVSARPHHFVDQGRSKVRNRIGSGGLRLHRPLRAVWRTCRRRGG